MNAVISIFFIDFFKTNKQKTKVVTGKQKMRKINMNHSAAR